MFNKQNFCHVASNNRNEQKAGIFVYKTTDSLATITASGYFNEKLVDINLHDLIIHEQTDHTDKTKVTYNILAVTERTLDNVGTIVIKRELDVSLEQAIATAEQHILDLKTYVDNNFVNINGTSVMTGPLLMRATQDFKCAIAPYWDGVGFFKLNDNDSVTLMASLEYQDSFTPAENNVYNIGSTSKKWKNLYLSGKAYVSTLNNGYDIAVPVTNSADTLALKSQVDDAANSGEQLYTTGVWYAKMYAATVVPTGAEYNGRNYADFSQVDSDNNPIIVIYEGQSGSWVEIARITPPANHVAYLTITSKIWDIAEQTDQQGGEILWSYNQKTFTPYPKIVRLLNQANTDLSNLTSTGKENISKQGTYDPNETYNAGTVGEAITGKANTSLDNVSAGIDFVVESQFPTAANNYTWYRKYKSGWIEQGGEYTGNAKTITLPVVMATNKYRVDYDKQSAPAYWASTHLTVDTRTTTSFTITKYGDNASMDISWQVSGMSAS